MEKKPLVWERIPVVIADEFNDKKNAPVLIKTADKAQKEIFNTLCDKA